MYLKISNTVTNIHYRTYFIAKYVSLNINKLAYYQSGKKNLIGHIQKQLYTTAISTLLLFSLKVDIHSTIPQRVQV